MPRKPKPRCFIHKIGFQDQTAYISYFPDGSATLTRKDGSTRPYTLSIAVAEGVSNWKEVTPCVAKKRVTG